MANNVLGFGCADADKSLDPGCFSIEKMDRIDMWEIWQWKDGGFYNIILRTSNQIAANAAIIALRKGGL